MRRVFVLLLLVAAVLLGGCARHPAATAGSRPSPTVATTQPQPIAMPSMEKSEPVSLDIPKIKVKSTLISLGLAPDGTVELPPVSTPMQASWFNGSPTPGEIGLSVILGHADGDRQAGIFSRLRELTQGDLIFVHRADGSTATFEVSKVEEVPRNTFPTDAVHGNASDAELRLISCGGYPDNVVAFAALT
jgi:LPXTG-site transpeptidase (sortase) family protein